MHEAGARVLNLSLAVARSPSRGERALKFALDHAARRGVIIVAAAGNQGTVGGTIITSHPWVIAVAACNANGKPVNSSNLGASIGLRGLCAPGEGVTSLGAHGQTLTFGGASVATPFFRRLANANSRRLLSSAPQSQTLPRCSVNSDDWRQPRRRRHIYNAACGVPVTPIP
jgi:subtilisin family serine protease